MKTATILVVLVLALVLGWFADDVALFLEWHKKHDQKQSPHSCVIAGNYALLFLRPPMSSRAKGNLITKVVPFPISDDTEMAPLLTSITRFTIDKPNPVPGMDLTFECLTPLFRNLSFCTLLLLCPTRGTKSLLW